MGVGLENVDVVREVFEDRKFVGSVRKERFMKEKVV